MLGAPSSCRPTAAAKLAHRCIAFASASHAAATAIAAAPASIYAVTSQMGLACVMTCGLSGQLPPSPFQAERRDSRLGGQNLPPPARWQQQCIFLCTPLLLLRSMPLWYHHYHHHFPPRSSVTYTESEFPG